MDLNVAWNTRCRDAMLSCQAEVAWFCIVWLTGAVACLPVSAQAPTPASAASAPGKDVAPSASVQRQADSVFRWIKIHSDKPRKATATAKPNLTALPVAKEVPAVGAAVDAAAPPLAVSAPELIPLKDGTAPVPPVVAAAPAGAAPVRIEAKEQLKPIEQPKPDFPEDIMAKLGKGGVKLSFMVQPDGSVSAPEILSTSHRRLNPSALAAISKWRFEPIQAARSAQVELGFDLE